MTDTVADLAPIVVGAGFACAAAFGWVAARTNFCTMGALSDVVNMGHWGRVRMWLLAVAVAMAGTAALVYTGQVDLARAVVRRPVLPVLSLLVGGLLFGVGMTLAGGCANRNLIRVGAGSVRSLVVLVFMAIAAYMTLKGLFGAWRVRWLDPVALDLGRLGLADQGLGALVSRVAGVPAGAAAAGVGLVLAALLAGLAFRDARFRANRLQWLGGLGLGALVVLGWYVTGHLGFGEHPQTMENVFFATNSRTIESLSFVAPVAYSLELLMLWTDQSLRLSFGIASAAGVVAGSALHALTSGSFRWEGFASMADLRNQLVGAVLMGFGGVTALGCTVGQGMSGLSTLAVGSFVATGAIVAGSVATLKFLLWQAERE